MNEQLCTCIDSIVNQLNTFKENISNMENETELVRFLHSKEKLYTDILFASNNENVIRQKRLSHLLSFMDMLLTMYYNNKVDSNDYLNNLKQLKI